MEFSSFLKIPEEGIDFFPFWNGNWEKIQCDLGQGTLYWEIKK